MLKTASIIFLLSFVISTSITAQNINERQQRKFYLGVKYIYSNSEDSDNDLREKIVLKKYRWLIGPDHTVHNTNGVEVLFGYKSLSFVNFELSGTYIPGYKGSERVTDVQNDYHQQDYKYNLYGISVNSLLITKFTPDIDAYFKAGIGYLIRDRQVNGSIRINMIILNNYQNYSDRYKSFVTRLGFGLKWYLLNKFPLIFEYEKVKAYHKLNDVKNWNIAIGINYQL